MKISQVAVQMYTLRDFLKTPAAIRESCKKIKAIGFQAVEAAGLGSISDEEFLDILRAEGLTLCSMHENGAAILDKPEEVAARFGRLGCKYVVYPYPGGITWKSQEDVLAFAKKLNHAGQVLKQKGLSLAYHNHHMEFRKFDGHTIFETFFKECEPSHLQAEIDTYWVQTGGGNPVAWCQMLKGRLPLLHMKDYAINEENKNVFAEVGSGNLDFKAICRAAEDAGCQWFIVEQDVCPGDPFFSIAKSFDWVRQHLAQAA